MGYSKPSVARAGAARMSDLRFRSRLRIDQIEKPIAVVIGHLRRVGAPVEIVELSLFSFRELSRFRSVRLCDPNLSFAGLIADVRHPIAVRRHRRPSQPRPFDRFPKPGLSISNRKAYDLSARLYENSLSSWRQAVKACMTLCRNHIRPSVQKVGIKLESNSSRLARFEIDQFDAPPFLVNHRTRPRVQFPNFKVIGPRESLG